MPDTANMVSLYDGQIDIKFSAKKHVYHRRINKEPVTFVDHPNDTVIEAPLKKIDSEWVKIPSTTFFTGKCLDKPELYNWMVDTTARTFRECVKQGMTLEDAESSAKGARFKALRAGGDIGSAVHSWIHDFILSEMGLGDEPSLNVTKAIENCIGGFLEWYEKYVKKPIQTEYIVYHPGLDVVGTLDFVFINNDDEEEVVDFKTGGNIYPADVMQLAFYRKAYTLQHGSYPDVATIVHLQKNEPKAIPLRTLDHEANMVAFECGHYLVNWRDTLKI